MASQSTTKAGHAPEHHSTANAVSRFSALNSNPRPAARQDSRAHPRADSMTLPQMESRALATPPWSPRDKPLPTPEQVLFQLAEMGTWNHIQNAGREAEQKAEQTPQHSSDTPTTISRFATSTTLRPAQGRLPARSDQPETPTPLTPSANTIILTPGRPTATAMFGIPSPPLEEPARLKRSVSQSLKNIFSSKPDAQADMPGSHDNDRRPSTKRAESQAKSESRDVDDPRTMKPYNTSTITSGDIVYRSTTIRGAPRDRTDTNQPRRFGSVSRSATLNKHKKPSLHTRTMSLPFRTTTQSRAGALRALTESSIDGPVQDRLAVKIPDAGLDRYSVMFEKVLKPTYTTTLAERRGTMTRLAPLRESIGSGSTTLKVHAHQRHATSPGAIQVTQATTYQPRQLNERQRRSLLLQQQLRRQRQHQNGDVVKTQDTRIAPPLYSPRTHALMEQSIQATNTAHAQAAERLMQIKRARTLPLVGHMQHAATTQSRQSGELPDDQSEDSYDTGRVFYGQEQFASRPEYARPYQHDVHSAQNNAGQLTSRGLTPTSPLWSETSLPDTPTPRSSTEHGSAKSSVDWGSGRVHNALIGAAVTDRIRGRNDSLDPTMAPVYHVVAAEARPGRAHESHVDSVAAGIPRTLSIARKPLAGVGRVATVEVGGARRAALTVPQGADARKSARGVVVDSAW